MDGQPRPPPSDFPKAIAVDSDPFKEILGGGKDAAHLAEPRLSLSSAEESLSRRVYLHPVHGPKVEPPGADVDAKRLGQCREWIAGVEPDERRRARVERETTRLVVAGGTPRLVVPLEEDDTPPGTREEARGDEPADPRTDHSHVHCRRAHAQHYEGRVTRGFRASLTWREEVTRIRPPAGRPFQ